MIVGATGHQDLPAEAIAPITRFLEQALSVYREDLVGVCSLARGADQLFANAVLSRGGQLEVIVPCGSYESTFVRSSDREAYVDLLGKASRVDGLAHPFPCETAFLEAGERVVERARLLIAVWDGKPARGKGGTADIVRYAESRGLEVLVIWPPGVAR